MKKRVCSILLAAAMILTMLPVTVSAAEPFTDTGTCGANVTYAYDSASETLTISGSGQMADYNPNYYAGDDIREAPWYAGTAGAGTRYKITKVIIGEGVTSIGNYAFYDCKDMTEITIPTSVKSIGASAFERCTSLTSIGNIDQVTYIGANAFSNTGLTSFTIPDGVTEIAWGTFESTKLTRITIPDSVTVIGGHAFYACHDITTVDIGNSVTSIGDEAFYDCGKITELTIPRTVTKIGKYAFQYCGNLKSIGNTENVTYIGEGAFYVAGLTSFTISNDVIEIAPKAFADTSLTSITIPDKVTKIGAQAFAGCDDLQTIIFTGNAPQIEDDCFTTTTWNPSKIKANVFYPKDNTTWTDAIMQGYSGDLTWFADLRTVTFHNESEVYQTQELKQGTTTVEAPTAPTKDGYNFVGWYTDSECTEGNKFEFTRPVQNDLDLYAKWERKGYKVTLHYNDGSTADAEQHVTEGGTATKPDPAPTRDGYKFGGWCTDESCENEYDFDQQVKSDLALYAKWTANTYNVTLHTNDGSINGGNVTGYTYGVGAPLPTDVTKTGHTFMGWYADENCTGTPVTAISETDIGNKEFFAKWELSKYTITLDTDGGTIQDGAVGGYTYGQGATLPKSVTKDGYTFDGWYEKSDFSGTKVTTIGKTETGDKTYYAKWKANEYEVTLNTNEGSINSGNVTKYIYGKGATLPENVTRTGYTFAGWVDSDGNAVTEISKTDTGDKVFSAKWTANTYQVTLEPNDGTIAEGENVTGYTYGIGTDLPGAEHVTMTGHTFMGWYDKHTDTKIETIGPTETGDKEFYAKWELSTYDVTLHTNGGSINSGNVTTYTYGTVATLPEHVTRTGYTFDGWYANSDCSGDQVTTIGPEETGPKAFYAKWTAEEYTVKLEPNHGTIAPGKDVTGYTYGVGAPLPTDVTRKGYTFAGWYEKSDFSGEKVTAISATDTGYKIYYARWTVNTYTATFLYDENGETYTTMTVPYTGFDPPADPTREGYTFLGWYYRESDGRDNEYNFGWAVEAAFTLYAKWGPYYFDEATGTLTISETMESLSSSAEQPWSAYRDKITKVVIKEGVEAIGGGLFEGCGSLTDVAIPDSVTWIAYRAFQDCTSLKTIDLPSSLEEIHAGAFSGCTALTSIEIPEGVTGIYNYAFDDCKALTSIEIPSSVTYVGDDAFAGCDNLHTVVFAGGAPEFGKACFGDVTATVFYPRWEQERPWTEKNMRQYGGTLTWRPNELTITFHTDGGSVVDQQITAYGGRAKKPAADPERAEYTFGGWYADAAYTKPFDFENTKITDDTIIYAKWTHIDVTYSPTVIPPDNGEVTIFPTSPKQDETVTITPKPDDGYEVDRVTVTDSEGKEITVRDNGDGTYSFIQPDGEVTITVTYQEIICPRDSTCPLSRFSDVFINAWYHDGIHYCLSNGLMKGTSDAVDNATFEPNGVTNRAMLVTVLYRLEGEPEVGACPFTDVQADVWYTDAITWAAENQIVKGYGNQLFGPEDYITREQFATILYRYAAYKGYDVTAKADITTFVDGADTAYWAADAMAWAVAEKLIIGMGNNQLAPRGDATRAQMATILYRFFKNLSK